MIFLRIKKMMDSLIHPSICAIKVIPSYPLCRLATSKETITDYPLNYIREDYAVEISSANPIVNIYFYILIFANC